MPYTFKPDMMNQHVTFYITGVFSSKCQRRSRSSPVNKKFKSSPQEKRQLRLNRTVQQRRQQANTNKRARRAVPSTVRVPTAPFNNTSKLISLAQQNIAFDQEHAALVADQYGSFLNEHTTAPHL